MPGRLAVAIDDRTGSVSAGRAVEDPGVAHVVAFTPRLREHLPRGALGAIRC